MSFGGQEGGGWEKFDKVPTPHVVTNKSIFLLASTFFFGNEKERRPRKKRNTISQLMFFGWSFDEFMWQLEYFIDYLCYSIGYSTKLWVPSGNRTTTLSRPHNCLSTSRPPLFRPARFCLSKGKVEYSQTWISRSLLVITLAGSWWSPKPLTLCPRAYWRESMVVPISLICPNHSFVFGSSWMVR